MEVEIYIRTRQQLEEIFNKHFESSYVRYYRKTVDKESYRSVVVEGSVASLACSLVMVPASLFVLGDAGMSIVWGLVVASSIGYFGALESIFGNKKEVPNELDFLATTENDNFLKNFDSKALAFFRDAYEGFQNKKPFVADDSLFPDSYNFTNIVKLQTKIRKQQMAIIRERQSKANNNVVAKPKGISKKKDLASVETAKPIKQQAAVDINNVLVSDLKRISDLIISEYSKMESDIVAILKDPLIFDMSFPATKEFMILVNKLGFNQPKTTWVPADGVFAKTVYELQFAWKFLKNEAERLRLAQFSNEERKRVERARMLISVALDMSVTAHERQAAYKRVVKELEGVIVIPHTAMNMLQSKSGLLSVETG